MKWRLEMRLMEVQLISASAVKGIHQPVEAVKRGTITTISNLFQHIE
jgi:hypothetical protein